ncbi:GH12636 [Drosophila grimshawi]|uniref:GH12636 n=1 Tax=Drosophila grimshawi TaxID=7222 RepID=B4JKC6_DROGR|nr:GH12636 [Drosophila grimshawi]
MSKQNRKCKEPYDKEEPMVKPNTIISPENFVASGSNGHIKKHWQHMFFKQCLCLIHDLDVVEQAMLRKNKFKSASLRLKVSKAAQLEHAPSLCIKTT